MSMEEWSTLPWHTQAMFYEGLIREGLYTPSDYEEGGMNEDDLEVYAASGVQVRTAQ